MTTRRDVMMGLAAIPAVPLSNALPASAAISAIENAPLVPDPDWINDCEFWIDLKVGRGTIAEMRQVWPMVEQTMTCLRGQFAELLRMERAGASEEDVANRADVVDLYAVHLEVLTRCFGATGNKFFENSRNKSTELHDADDVDDADDADGSDSDG